MNKFRRFESLCEWKISNILSSTFSRSSFFWAMGMGDISGKNPLVNLRALWGSCWRRGRPPRCRRREPAACEHALQSGCPAQGARGRVRAGREQGVPEVIVHSSRRDFLPPFFVPPPPAVTG